ncbi:DUF5927 domain-containing protein [Paracoccus saliphilus]|uniref:Peptide O-xylosyltransferase n=1 Tax=Paracoccus saliphilus TaxID=405559 RepID=A0AA45W7K6_9RHOB|nr:beta-1,6-N-acetylglucosaminyltransferase [Paracoccus saliphilus]WCR03057.1 glycosyl transferase [Paracoccus saliphilus]SIT10251.1 Core-2/I-Branching enzyme [Paracoccus saliphilus]
MTDGGKLGVVLLCHANLPMAARMARIWADGGAKVVIHIDAKVPAAKAAEMKRNLSDLPDILYSQRVRCNWGRFSLIAATQHAAGQLLEAYPECTHVYLASGSCLPLRSVSDLTAFLAANPGRDYIESVDTNEVGWVIGGLNEERFTLYFPIDWRKHRKLFDRCVAIQRKLGVRRKLPRGLTPHLGSQWWCLTARTLRAILNDPRRREYDRFFRRCWIPDESYFQTLARRHSSDIESRSLTFARFDHRGRPYLAYDDHLHALEEANCFVARKIWPGAARLLEYFPRPAGPEPDLTPPQPANIERMIARTLSRRILGRPGLYMQSRFPRKDAENGKTAAPYAVFQGMTDIFPGFEDWLREHMPGDVHGHLLGPEMVEFAGRPEIGPGALSSSAVVRDYDPQRFLTALIRVTERMQVFQFSPRDNQELNWFMATDPNAYLVVVTGAWNLPLLDMDMPFDDVRRITAMLQRTEMEQLQVLNSVWVKARVQLWEFNDFIARPQAILDKVLSQIDPDAKPVTELPPMRDIAGLPEHLQRLRNSGLHPHLTGDQPITKASHILARNNI